MKSRGMKSTKYTKLTKIILLTAASVISVCLLSGCGKSKTDVQTTSVDTPSGVDVSTQYVTEVSTGECVRKLIYQKGNGAASAEIDESFRLLEVIDESQANAWKEICAYWDTVNEADFMAGSIAPDGLAGDNSLCIVVMGYQLNSDGTMKDELIGRLSTALECARKYPEAYVLVTGGGTASANPSATEADNMANWLIENGVSDKRIIIENRSKTTGDNALFSYNIIRKEYPEINEVVIVTSDYHVPLSCLVFEAQFIMNSHLYGDKQLEVVSNAAYELGSKAFFTVSNQAEWLRILYDIQVRD